MPEDKPKDPCIFVRSTLRGSKLNKRNEPEDRVQIYLGADTDKVTGETHNQQIINLIEALTAAVNNPRGVNLDLHIAKKKADNGREFYSTYFFVKPTSESPAARGPVTATPKGQSLATRDRVESVRQGFSK